MGQCPMEEVSALKIRIRFAKRGVMKFIGHLDLMRYFQMAIRRAGIDIAYSEGYSPHQIMSFAAPLGVGMTSEGEYLDIEVKTTASSTSSIEVLNGAMADGMEVLGYRRLPEDSKTSMSILAAADYEVYYREGYEPLPDWQSRLEEFLKKPEIVVLKKTKKSEQEIDIRPHIYQYEIQRESVFFQVAAGSVTNIKPELIMEAFHQELGLSFEKIALCIHRKELYADLGTSEERKLVSLEELGEIIHE